jgi:prepilin-type N-terminal cleavage/methylation domain-containing protein
VYKSLHKRSSGFTIIEVVVATVILSIGLLAAAMLVTRTLQDTVRARQISLAALLASEKLEDLNRWPAADPHVLAPGGVAGDLANDTTANVVVGGVATPVNYFDDVVEAQIAGSYSETVSGVDAGGAPQFTTTTHAPDGTITTTFSAVAPARVTFKRRWQIEGNQPVVGVRRITVFVTNLDPNNPVTFQISTVRP